MASALLNPDRLLARRRYSDTRRDAIEYCAKMVSDHVSNIATFGKMFGR